MNIDDYYQSLCEGPDAWFKGDWPVPVDPSRSPGDVYEHLPTLKALGQRVNTITEFGVRCGYSTAALLAARPKKLTCYDINPLDAPILNFYEQTGRDEGIDFSFVPGSTLDIEIEPTELLFIDTLHTYTQLSGELQRHGDKVSKYLTFHDTVTFGTRGMDGESPSLIQAINEFMLSNAQWEIESEQEICNGLVILRNKLNTPQPHIDHPEIGGGMLDILTDTAGQNPTCVGSHNNLGLYWFGKDTEKALACFLKALELDPTNIKTVEYICQLYESVGRDAEAEKLRSRYTLQAHHAEDNN